MSNWMQGTPVRLVGATRLQETSDWADRAMASGGYLEQALRDLGFPEAEITDALQLRSSILPELADVRKELARLEERDRFVSGIETPADARLLHRESQSLFQRLRDWLQGKELRVQEVTEISVNAPLFLLSAPEPQNCSASFDQSVVGGRALAWSVKVAGTGLGRETSYSVTSSWKFAAQAGEAKLVFLPLVVTVARIDVVEMGSTISSGVQVVTSEWKEAYPPGLLLLNVKPPPGGRFKTFSLSGDTAGSVSTYGLDYKETGGQSFDIGIKAFGADVSLKGNVLREGNFRLQFDLVGGHDYELCAAGEVGGIAWKST